MIRLGVAWISLKPDYRVGTEDPTGFFNFRTTFSLAGYNPATAKIVLFLWSDDNVVSSNGATGVALNGIPTNVPPILRPVLNQPPFFGAITAQQPQGPFEILSGFVAGLNTLDITLQNYYFETGLRVEVALIAFRPNETPVEPVINDGPMIDNPGDVPGDYIQGPDGAICYVSGTKPKVETLVIGDSAFLDGTLCLRLDSCLKAGDKFVLISAAAGVFGEFSGLSLEGEINDQSVLRFLLLYGSNTVELVVSQVPYTLFAHTPNQTAVAKYLDKHILDPIADSLIRSLNCTAVNELPDASTK